MEYRGVGDYGIRGFRSLLEELSVDRIQSRDGLHFENDCLHLCKVRVALKYEIGSLHD
jgi:hypothetical protein